MTVSILRQLAALPSGEYGAPLDLYELGKYLSQHCDTDADKAREKRHQKTQDIYSDASTPYLNDLIDAIFKDATVRELRRAWAPYARFNNAPKRIADTISTLYTEPAKRTVDGDENLASYESLLQTIQWDAYAQHLNRMYSLHRAILVGFRVRLNADGSREPAISVLHPGQFRVVVHPNDATVPLGYLVRTEVRPARGASMAIPAWTLWTDHERVQFTDDWRPIPPTYVEHGYGICNYVPIVRTVGRAGFWPGEEGQDLIAAGIAIQFADLLMLKETKSATKQTVLAGDVSSMTRGQALDSEVPGTLPDGAAISTIDMSMDLALFREVVNHILESVANNYGINATQLRNMGTQSAEARESMRIPLRELRREQMPIFRAFERRFAVVMSTLLKAEGAGDQAFEVDGWRIDFADPQTPMTANEGVDLFIKMRTAGLISTVDYLQQLNPDLDEEGAYRAMFDVVTKERDRISAMRELASLSGGMSEAQVGTSREDTPDNVGYSPTSSTEDKAA